MNWRVTAWLVTCLLFVSSGLLSTEAAAFQRDASSTAQPPCDASHLNELVSGISAGADSLERGQAIERELARLRIPYESRPFEIDGKAGTNILATLPAAVSAPVLMLGAHLDRVASGRGALDNGAGVSVVLGLLAAFRKSPLQNYRMIAAFWDREEDGLAGSRAFLSSLPRNEAPSIYINFDMLGYGNVLCASWKNDKSTSAEAFRKAAGDQFPLLTGFPFPQSDDRPFAAAGADVVAIALADKDDVDLGLKMLKGEGTTMPRIMQIMHTAEDTPDKVRSTDICRALPVIERGIRLIDSPK
jgi:hypothetical protein